MRRSMDSDGQIGADAPQVTASDAAPAMDAAEFRDGLDALGLTQGRFARIVGAAPRTGQKWALGEARIPGSVAILIRLLIARPELLSVVEALGAPPRRARSR